MQMTDLMPVQDWAKLEQDIFKRFGVSAHAYTDKGALFTGQHIWGNRLCPALRKSKAAGSAICAVVNQAIGAEVRATRQPAVEDCDAGLMVVCVPVFVDDEFVGMVGGCGGLREDAEPETFLIEKAAGIPEDEATELCSDMRHYTEDEAQALASYIEDRVAQIVAAHKA